MNRGHQNREDDGFTLIELLVVIIIIGILAAIAIPVFLNQREKAYDSQTKADLKNAADAEESYLTDHFVYATTVVELQEQGFVKSIHDSGLGVVAIHPDFNNDARGTFCLTATSDSGKTFFYDSGAGTGVTTTVCS